LHRITLSDAIGNCPRDAVGQGVDLEELRSPQEGTPKPNDLGDVLDEPVVRRRAA
jgi:hypothetical protein